MGKMVPFSRNLWFRVIQRSKIFGMLYPTRQLLLLRQTIKLSYKIGGFLVQINSICFIQFKQITIQQVHLGMQQINAQFSIKYK